MRWLRSIPAAVLSSAALLIAALAVAAAAAPLGTGPNGELADLQQVTSRAVARVAPAVVRVIVPQMTRRQLEAAEQRERERRIKEQVERMLAEERGKSDAAPPEKTPDQNGGDRTPPKEDPAAMPPMPPGLPPMQPEEREERAGDRPEAPGEDEKGADKPPATGEDETESPKQTVRTGLLISPDGYVVTSMVNVGKQTEGLKVELADGRVLAATLLGEDLQRDLVLMKIDGKDLPAPQMAPKSDLAVGQWVLAVGRTLPIDEPTVSKGIISAVGRLAGAAVQTDANISAMNYGGPLVDVQGRVVAVIASVGRAGSTQQADQFSDSGIGFAIPIEDILAELPELKEGRRLEIPFLGIQFDLGRLEKGARVSMVLTGTAARESGLEAGDVIIEFAGAEVSSPFQLQHMIGSRKVGDTVTFKVTRGDEVLTLSGTLKPMPERFRRP